MAKTTLAVLVEAANFRIVGSPSERSEGSYTIEQSNGEDALGNERWHNYGPVVADGSRAYGSRAEEEGCATVPAVLFRRLMYLAKAGIRAQEEEFRLRQRTQEKDAPFDATKEEAETSL